MSEGIGGPRRSGVGSLDSGCRNWMGPWLEGQPMGQVAKFRGLANVGCGLPELWKDVYLEHSQQLLPYESPGRQDPDAGREQTQQGSFQPGEGTRRRDWV